MHNNNIIGAIAGIFVLYRFYTNKPVNLIDVAGILVGIILMKFEF